MSVCEIIFHECSELSAAVDQFCRLTRDALVTLDAIDMFTRLLKAGDKEGIVKGGE